MNNQPYHTDRVNEYPDAVLNAAETSEADIPITPLPNQAKAALWTAAMVLITAASL